MKPTIERIKRLMNAHKPLEDNLKTVWNRVKLEDNPIRRKVFPDYLKSTDTTLVSWENYITTNLGGYLYGKPVKLSVDSTKIEDEAKEKAIKDYVTRWVYDNQYALKVTEAGTYAIGGRYSWFHLNLNTSGKLELFTRYAWEVFADVSDGDIIGYIYQTDVAKDIMEDGETRTYKIIHYYDADNIYVYKQLGDGEYNELPDLERPNPFIMFPFFEVNANLIGKAFWELAEDLIDADNNSITNIRNEDNDFALAFLVSAFEINKELLLRLKQTGTIDTGGLDVDQIKWLTKELATDWKKFIHAQYHDKIHQMTAAIDLGMLASTSSTGIARQYLLQHTENFIAFSEIQMLMALRSLWQCITEYWQRAAIDPIEVDPMLIINKLERNIPTDIYYWAQATQLLNGIMSDDTRLKMLPFVPDSETEIEKMMADQIRKAEAVNATMPETLTDTIEVDTTAT